MLPLQTQLIAIDILLQELEECQLEYAYGASNSDNSGDGERLSNVHKDLLEQSIKANQLVISNSKDFSEYDFSKLLEQVELAKKISSKRFLVIYNKLLLWVLDYYSAKKKAGSITSEDFSEQAEIRLDLYQTKAAKAKSQIKTLAGALGKQEYVSFLNLYRLNDSSLSKVK